MNIEYGEYKRIELTMLKFFRIDGITIIPIAKRARESLDFSPWLDSAIEIHARIAMLVRSGRPDSLQICGCLCGWS